MTFNMYIFSSATRNQNPNHGVVVGAVKPRRRKKETPANATSSENQEHGVEVKKVTTLSKGWRVSRRSFTKRCFDGHESWSETCFGSANGPPLPPPSPLACMSLELWILPWGMRKLTEFPRSRLPHSTLVKSASKY